MGLRSRYRERPADNIPAEAPEPSEKISVEVVYDDATTPDVTAIEPADEATQALLKQLADLKKSEALQRAHAERMAQQQQPQTRVQFLQSQGLTKAEAEFFDSEKI